MASTPNEVLWPQIQRAQFDQVFSTQPSEFIQQLSQRFAFTLAYLSPTIEGLERASLAELKNHLHTRHPVGAFAVNQMADDVERAPSVFTFISGCPCLRQAAQKRIETSGRSNEKRYGVVQVVFHHAPIRSQRFSRESVRAIILQDKYRL